VVTLELIRRAKLVLKSLPPTNRNPISHAKTSRIFGGGLHY